jgi:hypothetical protein
VGGGKDMKSRKVADIVNAVALYKAKKANVYGTGENISPAEIGVSAGVLTDVMDAENKYKKNEINTDTYNVSVAEAVHTGAVAIVSSLISRGLDIVHGFISAHVPVLGSLLTPVVSIAKTFVGVIAEKVVSGIGKVLDWIFG